MIPVWIGWVTVSLDGGKDKKFPNLEEKIP